MKLKAKYFWSFLLLFCTFYNLPAQIKFGDNLGTIDNESVVEIESTTKVFVLPRMNTNQRDAIGSPLTGSLIFNIDNNCVEVNTGTNTSPNWICTNSNGNNDGGPTSTTSHWYNQNSTTATSANSSNTYQNAKVGVGDFSANPIEYALQIKAADDSKAMQLEANDPQLNLKDSDTFEAATIQYKGPDNTGVANKALEIVNQNGGRINFYTASPDFPTPDMTIDAMGRVGIGTANPDPSATLHVVGDIIATGDASDKRYKKAIQPIENALDKIAKINGVNYFYRLQEFPDMNFSPDQQIGVIAQEIEKVLPEVVINMANGYKAVKYEKITPLLLEAIKELKRENNQLQATLQILQASHSETMKSFEARLGKLEQLLTSTVVSPTNSKTSQR